MNLETLYIEVKLQTDEIKKGVEQAQAQIKNLEGEFKKLGSEGDRVSESFRKVANSVIGMFAGYASFRATLRGVNDALSAVREIGKASRELNVDATALDAWGHALQRTGGDARSFASTLSSLAQHFGTTNEIALRSLPRLADSFARLNPRQAQQFGKSLGLDLPTILLLQQGRREVEALVAQQEKLGLVTKEQTEITRKYDNALYDVGRAYQSFYRELALPLLPGITTALEYVIEHKDAVADSFRAMSVGLAALSFWVLKISGPIGKVAAGLTAIAATYGLVKEDIKYFKEGKDSLIGQTLGFTPGTIKSQAQAGKNIAAQGAGNFLLSIPSQVFGQIGQIFGVGGGGSNKTEVNINNVNINTQATDADGIMAAARGGLQQALSQLTSHVDNGVHS
jgi:hypothetical protein